MGKETGRLVNRVKGKVQTHFHRRCVRCRQCITEIRWKRHYTIEPLFAVLVEFFNSPLRGLRGTREGNRADQHS